MNSPIQPVKIWPGTADTLILRAGSFGPPPSFYYELATRIPGSTIPASGTPGDPDYLAPVEIPDGFSVLKNGNVSMNREQWDKWEATPAGKLAAEAQVDDDGYILAAIAENLGLTLAE